MKTKLLVTWGIILVLLVSVFGTAAAQTGTQPEPVPTDEAPTTGYVHPIAQVLGAYFGRLDGPLTVVPTATPDPLATPNPLATPDPLATPTPEVPALTPEEIATQIAEYHEEGMGFGVLVKLYAMAEASAEKCSTEVVETGDAAAPTADGAVVEPCVVTSVDELVTAFQGGQGMGQLFKEYGKPALLGVGHVKKELKKLEQVPVPTECPEEGCTVVEDPTTDTTLEESQDKGNNGNGVGNGNGNKNKDKNKAPKQKKP